MQDSSSQFAIIAVALPVHSQYHYRIPDHLLEILEPGHGVLIPFGPRRVSGFVIERTTQTPIEDSRLKCIDALLAPQPLFDKLLLELFTWTADYYRAPLGEVIRTALPPGILVASAATCVLTASGIQQLHRSSPDKDLELLQLIARDGPQSWQKLEQNKADGLPAAARRALKNGWIKLEHRLGAAKVKPQRTEVYRPVVAASPRDIDRPEHQLVFGLIQEMGEADIEDLRQSITERSRPLRRLIAILTELEQLGLIQREEREIWRDHVEALSIEDHRYTLTPEQQLAVDAMDAVLQKRAFDTCLLHGVTGSGKTAVYMQVVETTLQQGATVMILVPEISLTPQLVGRFRARFGHDVACLHSGMSRAGRFDAWRRLQNGDARVAIGARSAVFAPLTNVGLIIVDEEHDTSFKQDSGVRYHGRDLAIVRGRLERALVVLGSATPSLETLANTQRRRFQLLRLPSRVEQRPLPEVQLLDMTQEEQRPRTEDSGLAPAFEKALQNTLAAGQQAIILLNRRGFASFVQCEKCGGSFRCLHCDVSLTYHQRLNHLVCHYCGMTRSLPEQCPHCQSPGLKLEGTGTERLVQSLEQLLPGASIGRLDRDSVGGKGAYTRILDAFRNSTHQVLVGTQMVVKGHDFPNVTLVGIVRADDSLHLPDFRAAERTFQLITQVAGRAGRGTEPGRVFVQTRIPKHHAIRCAANHDVEHFVREELRLRYAFRYPPFVRIALILVTARVEVDAETHARLIAEAMRADEEQRPSESRVEILGPVPAPLVRVNQWYRWHLLLKCASAQMLRDRLKKLQESPDLQPRRLDLRVAIDMDTQHLL